MDNFNKKLLEAIDETIGYCLGDINAQILYQYMERKGCPKQEIPKRLDIFVETLEKLVGRGRGQILGPASILENAVLKQLCKKLGIKNYEFGSTYFPDQCNNVMKVYLREKGSRKSPCIR